MSTERLKNIAYWVSTILGPASFVVGGVLQLSRAPEVVSALNHLGYPLYFATILGVWKIAGAIAVVVPGLPRVKEWAYAGFVFDLTAAAASHTFSGDTVVDVVSPLLFLGLVVASWALRPASRTLAASSAQPLRPAVHSWTPDPARSM